MNDCLSSAGAALAQSPGAIVGIVFAVLLLLVVVVIYFRCKISKLQEQVGKYYNLYKLELCLCYSSV